MSQIVAEQVHAVAVLAALNAVLTTGRKAYDIDALALMSSLPNEYVEVSVIRRFYGGVERQGGGSTAGGWRVLTREVSGVSVENARTLRNKVSVALERQRLAIGGKRTTPIRFETSEPIGPDEGRYSGYETWTYVL